MRFAFALALLLIAGCAHVEIGVNARSGAGSQPVRGGTSMSTTTGSVQVHASGAIAAAILAGMVIAAAASHHEDPSTFHSWREFSDWFWGRRAPPLAPKRPVNLQDCTQPVQTSGNLHCR